MTHPFFEIGKCYFVRDGVDYWVGKLVDVLPHALVLEDCSWIASTGRLHEFMAKGKAENMEVEPLGEVRHCVQWRSVSEWPHKLFTKAV